MNNSNEDLYDVKHMYNVCMGILYNSLYRVDWYTMVAKKEGKYVSCLSREEGGREVKSFYGGNSLGSHSESSEEKPSRNGL